VADRDKSRVQIRKFKTGVPGLDAVLGGGLPEYSFTMIAGGPGSGKTTLVQQLLFANASPERPALFITVLGEPTIKLLRHQQQFDFFDISRIGVDIHFLNLSEVVLGEDLNALLTAITDEVERLKPAFVAVDSFRAIARTARDQGRVEYHARAELDHFVQRLAIQLTASEITSFLIGEHHETDWTNPVFTVADGIVWLTQATDQNSVVRKLQVIKVRGQASMPGLHTFRIISSGLQVFPRLLELDPFDKVARPDVRLSTGIEGLDAMTGGGIPSGDVVLVAGPTGSGKTTFGMQFALEGLRMGQASIVAVFEERPREYLARAALLGGASFQRAQEEGRFEIMYLRPLDLSVDETMQELRDAVERIGATRVVIDSLSGFEVALAPTFRAAFRESLYRLLGMLTTTGVTVLLTNEVVGGPTEQRFTRYALSFLCDDIIVNRFIELDSEYRRVCTVLKMRRARHSRAIRSFDITERGVEIGDTLPSYHGITTGVPSYSPKARPSYHGLTTREALVGATLEGGGKKSLLAWSEMTGMKPDNLAHILERLIELGYVAREVGGDEIRYLALGKIAP